MLSENVNVTLSLTLKRGDEDNAVPLVARCLTELVTVIPDLISGTLSIYSDDFIDSEGAEPSGDVHIVETTGTDVGQGIRQAFTRGEEKGLPFKDMSLADQERLRNGDLP
jgi:hypothetical protein